MLAKSCQCDLDNAANSVTTDRLENISQRSDAPTLADAILERIVHGSRHARFSRREASDRHDPESAYTASHPSCDRVRIAELLDRARLDVVETIDGHLAEGAPGS